MYHKKPYRLDCDEGLSVRRRRGRKRARGSRAPMLPLRPKDRWSMESWPKPSALRGGCGYWRSTTTAGARTCFLAGDTSILGERVARELGTLFGCRPQYKRILTAERVS